MEKLLFVPDIMARYRVSAPTARKIMREMEHMEKPKLAVTERAVIVYELEKARAASEAKAPKRKKEQTKRVTWIPGVSRVPLRN